ncbi:uncharacterized protein [Eurosta solidaginis]|uniref:uncharacterized protein n=1 Tax=Eurosta solidaginis TaxID=178769 RepID=UPI003531796E
MAKRYMSSDFQRNSSIKRILVCAIILNFILAIGIPATTVTFDDDCSNVECPPEPSFCPADSVERKSDAVFDVLYSPDEFVQPQDFFDDVGGLAEGDDEQNEEVPFQPSMLTTAASTKTPTASTTTANEPTNRLLYNLVDSSADSHREAENKRMKREQNFAEKVYEDADEQESMLSNCCSRIPEEQLQLRRRRRIRRHSILEDCECKPCGAVPVCPSNEVIIQLQEAAGTPGNCCPSWACAPRRACDDIDAQPYWRDACTRCSCYGTKGPELCHNECPTLEEQETQLICFSADTLKPMEHGSDWYENDYCTNCHCENGMRECVENLCKPATCKRPIKVIGQCCPQCPENEDENVLVSRENSTHSNANGASSTERVPRMKMAGTTAPTLLESTTTESTSRKSAKVSSTELTSELATAINSTASAILGSSATASSGTKSPQVSSTELTSEPTTPINIASSTLLATSTAEITSTSTVPSTDLINKVSMESTTDESNQSTSTETTKEFVSFSTTTSELFSSSTELTSTAKFIDDISSEDYFGLSEYSSTKIGTTTTDKLAEEVSESSSQSSQTVTSSPQSSSQPEPTETLTNATQTYEHDSTSTTASASPESSMYSSSESSTEESTSSTESFIDGSAFSSSSTDDTTETVSTADIKTTSSTVTPLAPTPVTGNFTAYTTSTSSQGNATTPAAQTDFSTSSTPVSSTTISTTSLITEYASTTQTHAPSTSSPYTSSVNPSTSTTSSPFTTTTPAPPTTTVTYWYTFSTSAPSPPMPQPTVYQPSVRQFFTRPEVRYIGAVIFVALLAICALAVWKFCMTSHTNTRRKIKNRYRTVPSSEATSLSHSPTTSHSSMA